MSDKNNEDTVWEVPCLECGSLPEAGYGNQGFHVGCSNEKCPMAIRMVLPEYWPQTKEAFDANYDPATQTDEYE